MERSGCQRLERYVILKEKAEKGCEHMVGGVGTGGDLLNFDTRYQIQWRQQGGNGKEDKQKTEGCETCKNRKYTDGSNDPGVSYKTPAKISPDEAPSAVKGHEMEHVFRERSKAARENKEVVSQSVVMHTSTCPECGRVYVSGGTTRTTTRTKKEDMTGLVDPSEEKGKYFDKTA